MSRRHISLTLTARYASSWGTWEGIRELIQNWHDGIQDMAAERDFPVDIIHNDVCFEPVEENDTEFEAYIQPVSGQRISLGHLIYDKLSHTLSLTNHKTSLQKKILLLGYSLKSDKAEIIGQFGEGLKIGALALVRNGHIVTMETSDDVWRFELLHNEEFGEKVLTVVVTERSHFEEVMDSKQDDSLIVPEATDTCTTVRGLSWSDWKTFVPRFLFLKPPQDSVKTTLGTLLLDTQLAGQLYVKGLWVGDLRSEDLAAGVSFSALQLDRDRNAVPKPSEIDHLLSCIWIKAIEKRPVILQRYFHLLRNDKYRDVRHAAQYSTETVAIQIANQFLREYGEDAFPVLNSAAVKEIQAVRDELQRTVILCNQQLLDILLKSGKYLTMHDAMEEMLSSKRVHIPYSSLTVDQKNVLRKATELVKMADSPFCLGMVDISGTDKMENCSCHGNRVTVPSWFLDKAAVHSTGRICHSEDTECYCCEVKLCSAILDMRKVSLPVVLPTQPLVDLTENGEIPLPLQNAIIMKSINHVLQIIIHGLLTNNKTIERTWVLDYSKSVTKNAEQSVDLLRAESIEREQKYIQTIAELEEEVETEKKKYIEQLSNMKHQLNAAEADLMAREISTVNCEQTLRQKYETQRRKMVETAQESIQALKEDLCNKDSTVLSLQQQLINRDKILQEIRQEKENLELAVEKRTEGLLDELSHYVTQHRNRTESLLKLCKKGCSNVDKATRDKCWLLSNMCELILQDLQQEKFICAVCKLKRKDCLLQPCGHYSLCQICANELLRTTRKCPICTETFSQHIKVYE